MIEITETIYHSTLTFIIAAIALLATPGPATLALAASGAAYGIKRSLKFYFGVIFGLILAISCVASGLYVIVRNFSFLGNILMTISALYILYLAYCIAMAAPIKDEKFVLSPGFGSGLTIGITNVKAYIAFAALLGSFTLGLTQQWEQATKAMICIIICITSDFLWLFAGSKLRTLFVNPVCSRILNVSFATLMVATIAWSLAQVE